MTRFIKILIVYYQNAKQVIEKVIVLNRDLLQFLKNGGNILTKGSNVVHYL